MAKEVNKAKEQLDKAEKELRQMSSLNKVGRQICYHQLICDVCLGPQSLVTCSSFTLARIQEAYCSSLQARLPDASFQSWVLWQDFV